MNFQTAAIVAGIAFLLSLLSGLIGGVPLFDVVLRALFWAVAGFGASLGIETLLRSMLPDLFVAQEEAEPPREAEPQGQAVNITLDDDIPVRGGFVEEVDEDEPAPAVARPALEPEATGKGDETGPTPSAPASRGPSPAAAPDTVDEEMPEIGSFLDAFKPESAEGGESTGGTASVNPDYGEYAPVEPERRAAAAEVTIDGEAQDPAQLARAVQTVMKRDA